LLKAADTWVALSLARPSDVDLLPAFLGIDGVAHLTDAVWSRAAGDLIARASLLGIPCARLGEVAATGPIVLARTEASVRKPFDKIKVVDLSALWAGPLCANLLALAGASIVNIESVGRPDSVRAATPRFYDLLHAGHELVTIDFTTTVGRENLRALIEDADVVIEASRPRALYQLGIDRQDLLDRGWQGVWTSITGHGRDGEAANRVGFGDDAAVAGGLVAYDRQASPMFCADAIADPATGLLAAVATVETIVGGERGLVDVALARTAAHLAAGVTENPPVIGPVAAIEIAAPHSSTRRAA
jgi:crotonobetainyl-CoA:carnitine CoA-transferase CaiB-like acyl-CoA transferase